jgi:hypothetical protein
MLALKLSDILGPLPALKSLTPNKRIDREVICRESFPDFFGRDGAIL